MLVSEWIIQNKGNEIIKVVNYNVKIPGPRKE